MALKLVRRPKSPNWIMRGTVRGQSIEETTGTPDKAAAEAIRVKREKELLDESIYGKQVAVTFAIAALDYIEHGGGEQRFLKSLVDHFGTTLLREIEQHAIDLAAKKLYPKAGPATRNRQVYTPMAAILRHAARKGWCAVPTLERPKQPKGRVRWLRPEEAERLIAACAAHLRPLVVFMLSGENGMPLMNGKKPALKTDVTPHVCRHTWATWHYQANRDFTKLQELGGWKTLAMVMRYAHTNVETHSDSINALPWGKSGETSAQEPGKVA